MTFSETETDSVSSEPFANGESHPLNELRCGQCPFKTSSPSGLKRHVTRTHGKKKVAKAKAEPKTSETNTYGKGLKERWSDDQGRALLVDKDGELWIAKKLVV